MGTAQPPQRATSGIAGAVWTDAAQVLRGETLDRMLVALAHRGGNGRRCFRRELTRGTAHVPVPGVTMGETCDVADPCAAHGSWAPAASEDQSVVAVLDGYLLNHATLRHRLEGAGHRLRGDSHAELLVHLYEDQGSECFEHVEGPLAAAVWDTNRRTLVLARDRLGQKPLFYRAAAGQVLFANSLRALTEAAVAPAEIDPTALDEYLTFGYVPHPHCLWRGFQKLPPGYVAICRDGQLTFRRYWTPDFQTQDDRPLAELQRDLRERLETAVAACVAGDEPIGVWLSGGVDSAIIAALARRATTGPVHSFCIQSPVPEHDESAAAEALAAELGLEHHTVPLNVRLGEETASYLAAADEPLADPVALTQGCLAGCADWEVRRVLTGFGADELLGGYPRYGRVPTWRERWPAWLPALRPQRRRATGESASDQRPSPLDEARGRRYLQAVSLFDEAARSELYTDEFLAQLPAADPYDLLRAALAAARGRDPITAVSLADVQTSLPCLQLAGCDAAISRQDLECCHPLLDARVAELAMAVPGRWKWRRGLGKRILREAFADLLPSEVLRRGHRPWPPPAPWPQLRAHARDWLADESHSPSPFSCASIDRLCQESSSADDEQRTRQIWALVVLDRWLRSF